MDMPPGCSLILSPGVMFLFIISVTFFVFTLCMMCEQYDVILTNRGKIARMKILAGKAEEHELGRVTNDFNEVFGGDSPYFAYHWLLPLPIKFPEGMRDVVLGYEWEPGYQDIFLTPDNSTVASAPSILTDVPTGDLVPAPENITGSLIDQTNDDKANKTETEPELTFGAAVSDQDPTKSKEEEKTSLLKND
eukprot:CAMPEP_0172499550 /NCGR_PEP_ID=MMETSP1066-20121228/128220_1 /TAXON_ID=671091 /ORGANISM="Coscinodiscus wailesii, Strain CCMP2513" /LENGTH=191 /DNA_ID=CAMNT_0013273335 /DNA_START=787 /DNA_END=1362 /DNA_ORIENTATION=+